MKRPKIFFEYNGKRYRFVRDGASVRYYCHNCCFNHPEGCMRLYEVMNCLGGHWKETKKEKEPCKDA